MTLIPPVTPAPAVATVPALKLKANVKPRVVQGHPWVFTNEIEALIKAGLPDAQVTIEDLAGDGDHYAAKVVSEAFRGKSRVQQHQLVYAALRGRMGGELHALALQTSAPD